MPSADALPHPGLSLAERLGEKTWVKRLGILALLALAWEGYARFKGNSLILPTFSDAAAALWARLLDGSLPVATEHSLKVLLIGYGIGVALAALLSALAVSSRLVGELLATLTAMFNPLPAVALLPLAFLWFGLGTPSLVFVIAHSVLWPVALATTGGFAAVGETLRMSAANIGLKGPRLVALVLIPAAFAPILSGLRIGWAFAWRTLIAAELVFGVTSSAGGLGWFIFENRNRLEIANVFAGLVAVIVIGLVVEGALFAAVESRTTRRWGLQR